MDEYGFVDSNKYTILMYDVNYRGDWVCGVGELSELQNFPVNLKLL